MIERLYCEWFAKCVNEADGLVPHPILGQVPTCSRCALRLGLDLDYFASADEVEEAGLDSTLRSDSTDRPWTLSEVQGILNLKD